MINIIAGILIGIANKDWLARIIVPFIWGFIYCIYYLVYDKGKLVAHNEEMIKRDIKPRWGMTHTQSFYFIEYFTASTTSFIFSILSGIIKDLF